MPTAPVPSDVPYDDPTDPLDPVGRLRGSSALGMDQPKPSELSQAAQDPPPLGLTPWNPDWVTHKVAEVAEGAGVSLNIKALRHYTASQLLAGGIDLRNTAARLGHGGGGSTTLRHYADPVSEVDRRAAAYLARLTADAAPTSP